MYKNVTKYYQITQKYINTPQYSRVYSKSKGWKSINVVDYINRLREKIHITLVNTGKASDISIYVK